MRPGSAVQILERTNQPVPFTFHIAEDRDVSRRTRSALLLRSQRSTPLRGRFRGAAGGGGAAAAGAAAAVDARIPGGAQRVRALRVPAAGGPAGRAATRPG